MCGVSECDSEASIMGRPWPIRGCCTMKKSKTIPRVNLSRNIDRIMVNYVLELF